MSQEQENSATKNAYWGRKWRILIMDEEDQEALNISELHIIFSIHRSREVQNYATVKIYNLSAETEKSIIEKGDRITIEAGYENDEMYGLLFDGKIIYPARSKDNNTDYVLSLLCVDGQNILQKAFIAKTVNRGLNQRQVLDSICKSSSTSVPQNKVSDDLSQQKLPRGKVFFGATKNYISDICRGNAATYTVENGQLNVIKLSDKVQDEAIVVTPKTGLIGMPAQTQYGASFTLLLNPNISMACMVQLKNSEINENLPNAAGQQQAPLDDEWIYQVIEFTHEGDTYGNEWYTHCTGISRYGTGALPALLANSQQNGIGG